MGARPFPAVSIMINTDHYHNMHCDSRWPWNEFEDHAETFIKLDRYALSNRLICRSCGRHADPDKCHLQLELMSTALR